MKLTFHCHFLSRRIRPSFEARSQPSLFDLTIKIKLFMIFFSYTTGHGVEGYMKLTVRLKPEGDNFEPAVNIIPTPDQPGPKLDYPFTVVNTFVVSYL